MVELSLVRLNFKTSFKLNIALFFCSLLNLLQPVISLWPQHPPPLPPSPAFLSALPEHRNPVGNLLWTGLGSSKTACPLNDLPLHPKSRRLEVQGQVRETDSTHLLLLIKSSSQIISLYRSQLILAAARVFFSLGVGPRSCFKRVLPSQLYCSLMGHA